LEGLIRGSDTGRLAHSFHWGGGDGGTMREFHAHNVALGGRAGKKLGVEEKGGHSCRDIQD